MKKLIYIPFLLLTFYLNAQTDTIWINQLSDTIKIEETIIQAFRADKYTPVTFKNITQSDLDVINIGQEPSEILSYTPSIHSFSDAGNYQGYSYFRLRGIDQTRINMTIDGIPLNEPEDQGVYFSNYPDFFNSIESLQIQRGVGTTVNGVASYAGSINFQSPNLRKDSYTEIGANYGSYNTYRVYGEYNSGLNKDKALYVRITNQGSDGYKYHSGNKSSSAFLSGGIFMSKHKLKFTGFIGRQRNQLAWIGVPEDTISNDPKTNGNSDENDDFTQALVSVQHSFSIKSNLILNNTAYYNYLDGNYDFDLNNFLGLPSNEEMYNYDFQHNFIGALSNINWYKGHFRINAGIHLNAFTRRHIGSERNIGTLYENHGYKNEFSSFFKVKYRLNKFNLFADLQYRHTTFDYVGSVEFDKMEWNFLNPKVGANYFISNDLSLYYSFGSCGREPTRNDLFYGEDNLPSDSNGNPIYSDVSPEYVYNHELGFKIHKKRWFLYSNVYLMNFENEIVLNGQYGPNGLPLHSNVAKSFRSGIEVDFSVDVYKGLYYQNNTSLSYNRISENGIEFQPILTPNFILNQLVAYKSNALSLGITSKYQEEAFIDFGNKNLLPSFFTLGLFSSYQHKALTFQAGINNITNRTILANAYIGIDGTPLYFVQAPVNYNIGMKWNF